MAQDLNSQETEAGVRERRSGRRLDESVYDAIDTQLSQNDRISLLTLQAAVRARYGKYSYLEIGSFRGGSLQPFLVDDACSSVYSVDPHTGATPDARPRRIAYRANTTEGMVEGLTRAYGDRVAKLRCFESDASQVSESAVPSKPSLCFIDGEHTDSAFERDFASCLRLAADSVVIASDDTDVIYRGLRTALRGLERRGQPYRAYMLPDKIGVVEIGGMALHRDELVRDRLASIEASMYLMEELSRYRDFLWTIGRIPGVVPLRWILSRLPFGSVLKLR